MSTQADKFKIGLFVVSSLFLAVVVVIWLGASRFFEVSQTLVAYFTESVQGLETGTSVRFRGVPVGRIKGIRMAPDGRLIEVVLGLDRNFKVTDDLGIKMNLMGLTGMKYLEMDTFRPDQQKEPIVLTFEPSYRVVPTYPSDIREIGTALENIFQKVKALDVDRMSNNYAESDVTARHVIGRSQARHCRAPMPRTPCASLGKLLRRSMKRFPAHNFPRRLHGHLTKPRSFSRRARKPRETLTV